MNTKMFVNLPVKDLKRTKEFFAGLGFAYNPQFTDDNAACMIVGEDNYAMLLVYDFFKTFIPKGKDIADSEKSVESIVSLTAESREKVDEMVDKAIQLGGKPSGSQDYGWMYERGFEDLDGHLWEIGYMDLSAVPDKM